MSSVLIGLSSFGRQRSTTDFHPQRILCLGTAANVTRIEDTIIRRLAALDYSPHDSFAVVMSLEEALRNAVTHGNGNDQQKCIEVVFLLSKFGVWMRIEDEGSGFRPNALPDPSDDDQLSEPHGRGVFLMRELMDRVVFNQKGNAVTLEFIRKQPRN